MTPAAFLDRDGVVLRLVAAPGGGSRGARSLAEAELIEGAAAAVRALAGAGYACVVVTNQPDVGRGLQSADQLAELHRHLRARLPLTGVYACCHSGENGCGCRKPAPGMLLEAAARHRLDLPGSIMFGDRWSDFAAARAAGCRFCWITGNAQDPAPPSRPGAAFATLAAAVRALLADPTLATLEGADCDVGSRRLHLG